MPTSQKNIYSQKQACRVWNQYVHKGLMKLRFTQSAINECVYYQDKTILLCYVDDTIVIDPDNSSKIDKLIQEIKDLDYNVTDEGDLEDYLAGITIEKLGNKSFKMSQPQMIQQILQDLNLAHSDQDTNCS